MIQLFGSQTGLINVTLLFISYYVSSGMNHCLGGCHEWRAPVMSRWLDHMPHRGFKPADSDRVYTTRLIGLIPHFTEVKWQFPMNSCIVHEYASLSGRVNNNQVKQYLRNERMHENRRNPVFTWLFVRKHERKAELIMARLQASAPIIILLMNFSYQLAGSLISQWKWLIMISFTYIFMFISMHLSLNVHTSSDCNSLLWPCRVLGGGCEHAPPHEQQQQVSWWYWPRMNLNCLCAVQQAVFNHG